MMICIQWMQKIGPLTLILKSIGMIYHYEIKSQQNISTEQ